MFRVSFMVPIGENESSISTLSISSSLGDHPFGLLSASSDTSFEVDWSISVLFLLAGVSAKKILFCLLRSLHKTGC